MGELAYTETNYISANYIEHEIYYAGNYGAKGEKRSERQKPTPLEIKKNNHWNKVKYYRRLMQLNFYPGDLWTCLKYKAGTRKDINLVKSDLRSFFSHLRKAYKKAGYPLMFIYNKGTEVEVEAYKLLSENSDINFVGNIEGNRITRNACDVLVTDGFTGNIFLKTMEGMGAFMIKTLKDLFTASIFTKIAYLLVKPKLGGIKKGLDSAEYGGAPILGIAKPVIKAHGSSKAKAFKNAIRQALACSETDVTGEMSEALLALAERKKSQRTDGEAQSE